jgi:hypothetical protein
VKNKINNMVDFEKIAVFHTDMIVHQKVERTFHTSIYGVTVKLKNGDEIYFTLKDDDWFKLIGYLAWNNGNVYILYLMTEPAKFFVSYSEIENFIKGEI